MSRGSGSDFLRYNRTMITGTVHFVITTNGSVAFLTFNVLTEIAAYIYISCIGIIGSDFLF
jgi:hypothetical protein